MYLQRRLIFLQGNTLQLIVWQLRTHVNVKNRSPVIVQTLLIYPIYICISCLSLALIFFGIKCFV